MTVLLPFFLSFIHLTIFIRIGQIRKVLLMPLQEPCPQGLGLEQTNEVPELPPKSRLQC